MKKGRRNKDCKMAIKTTPKRTEEIVICKNCEGTGKTLCRELTNPHKGEYDTWEEPCKFCEGSGRMLMLVSTELKPFKPISSAVPPEQTRR